MAIQGRKELVTLLRPRDDIPWGFRFAHVSSPYPEITRINAGSLAAQHLRIGQLIIDVNGVHTLGMTACEVANLVRHQGNKLNLLLQSRAPSNPAPPNYYSQTPGRDEKLESVSCQMVQSVYKAPSYAAPVASSYARPAHSDIQVHRMATPSRKPAIYANARNVIRVQNAAPRTYATMRPTSADSEKKLDAPQRSSRLMQLIQEDEEAKKIGVLDPSGGSRQFHNSISSMSLLNSKSTDINRTFPRVSRPGPSVHEVQSHHKVNDWFQQQPSKSTPRGSVHEEEETEESYTRLPVRSRIGNFEALKDPAGGAGRGGESAQKVQLTSTSPQKVSTTRRPLGAAGRLHRSTNLHSQSVIQLTHNQPKPVVTTQHPPRSAAATADARRGSYFGEVTDSYTDF